VQVPDSDLCEVTEHWRKHFLCLWPLVFVSNVEESLLFPGGEGSSV
jgi:hypothetical protein